MKKKNVSFQTVPFSFWWNQKTPIGYLYEICVLNMIAMAYLFCNASFLLLFISMSLHHNAFYHMFGHTISKLGKGDNRTVLLELIKFHSSIKT